MIRIILIDDHKIILDGISAVLESDNTIELQGAFLSPKAAQNFLIQNPVDVIFTDLDMPEMKGEDVLLNCKKNFPSAKVIVLSMHNDKTVIKHLISIGADGYLIKSAGKEEIIQAINTVYAGSKYFSDEVLKSLINDEEQKKIQQSPAIKNLSNREIEIIKLIAKGYSSKQIGKELFISPRTAETHRNNILKKLDTQGIAGIIRFAFQNNLAE